MALNLSGVATVLLPGTGSDDDYVYRAFAGLLHDAGAVVLAQRPEPSRLVAGYLEALDEAARQGPIAVGGVSIGAAVAVAWALAHPGAPSRCWPHCRPGPANRTPHRPRCRPGTPQPRCAATA